MEFPQYLLAIMPEEAPRYDLKPRILESTTAKFRYYDFDVSGSSLTTTWKDEEDIRQEFWYPNLKEGSLVFDIGADHGSYTLPALAHGCYVVAVTPERYDRLSANLDLNSWYGTDRCLALNAAFYDKKGYLDPMMQHFSEKPASMHYAVGPMDDTFSEWPDHIDIMKIDVEGAEIQVLKGAKKLLLRTEPKLIVECHNFKEPGVDEAVINHLTHLNPNYKFKREDHHATKFVYAYI